MNISKVIGENIKHLMDLQNISNRKLAEIIHVSHPTVSSYISGERAIDSGKLKILADYFNKPMDYFFSEKKDEIVFQFRADKPNYKVSGTDIQNFQKTLYSYLDIMKSKKYYFTPPVYNLNFTGKKLTKDIEEIVERIAEEQRRLMNIDHSIPENYYEVIQKLGVNVIVRKFNNLDFSGASTYSKEYGSFIIVNDDDELSEERKIFTLIHEYAHLLFHKDQYKSSEMSEIFKRSKFDLAEKIADKFAGYFLLPRVLVKEYASSRNDIVDAVEMKQYFKVSIQSLYYNLYDYGEIKKAEYTKFHKDISIHGYKKTEPDPLPKIPLEDKNIELFSQIKKLYYNDQISANKINEVAGLSTLETRKILNRWRQLDERNLRLS